LNLSYFIAKRIGRKQADGFSATVHSIATASIAIGLAASIVAFLIMRGFQETIKEKIYSFSAHIIITKYTLNNSTEEQPFDFNIDLYNHYQKYGFVDHIQEFSHKPGLIKSEDEILGIVFKGVGKSFDLNRFRDNIVQGRFIHFPDSGYSHEVVLSEVISNKIKARVGDDIVVHFFQQPPRFRKLKVVGTYETNLSDYFDGKIIMGDIRMVQRLNGTGDSIAGGLQVFVKDVKQIDKDLTTLEESIDYDLFGEKVRDTYIQVFEWLDLISRQVYILLGIILTVISVNMISVVLILVMERTPMIGVLKAIGAQDRTIRSIFVLNGVRLLVQGLLGGNLLGVGLCFAQDRWHFIKLNAHDYYMSYVPITWDWQIVIFLNLMVFTVVTVVLLLPTAIVSRINPIRAIRFD
jgi:lipoprotein-releasing system permease protein